MRRLITLSLLLTAGFLSGQQRTNSEWAMNQPYVVIISIDGFRYDYAEKFNAQTLLDIKKSGSSAKSMVPSFPSKTFPNHYTLISGLYPDNHGIVGNSFYSRSRDVTYKLSSKKMVLDSTWYGGKPIWSLAEENGMLSASFFWVGSESAIMGYKPTYYKVYDQNVPNKNRTGQVIEWLKMSEETRPHLITLYFSSVDDAGHQYGPDTNEVRRAVLSLDSLIGDFRKKLIDLNLPITLMVTADHGMSAVNRGLAIDDINFRDAVVDISSTMVMVYHKNQKVLSKIKKEMQQKKLWQVYTKKEMKEEFGFDNDDRVGDLVGLVNPPVHIIKTPRPVSGGTHGYNPNEIAEMHAIFMLEGPTIKKNYIVPSFKNVNVYPLIAELLNLPVPEGIDGKLEVLRGVIKE